MSKDDLLKVTDLVTSFMVDGKKLTAVRGVSFSVEKGKTLGIVGESGCGKSVTSLSMMQLIPTPPGKIESGRIELNGEDLLKYSDSEMEKIRGNRISMIFQEPMTALNPVYRVGEQVAEAFIYHRNMGKKEAFEKSIDMLRAVGIPSPEQRAYEYPHQLSGGMRQRVMIAIALACEPELLIADEPTTALDVTIQMQILTLMKELQKKNNMAIVFITHDLGVVAEMCDDVVVMYAGKVVEQGPVVEIFKDPKHPYTKGLMGSLVGVDQDKDQPLEEIDGMVPSLANMPKGCAFRDRCPNGKESCEASIPELNHLGNNHSVSCFEVSS